MKKKRKKQRIDDKRLALTIAYVTLMTAIISMTAAIISLITALR